MKQKLLTILIGCFFCTVITAQQMRVNVYTGYVFDDRVDSYYSNTSYYNGIIKGGFRWGGGLEYMTRPNMGISLNYKRLDTNMPTEYYDGGIKNRNFDLGANWLMLGATRYMQKNNFEPFFGIEAGIAFFSLTNPVSGNGGSGSKFAWGIKGGTNIFFSKSVGIKLQADLYSATQAVGGAFYFGTGGAGAGLASYSSIYQFGLGGGLVFKLAKKG